MNGWNETTRGYRPPVYRPQPWFVIFAIAAWVIIIWLGYNLYTHGPSLIRLFKGVLPQ